MILRRMLVLTPHRRKSSEHDCVYYPAAFLHLLNKFLLLSQLQVVSLVLSNFQGFHHLVSKPLFPILFHECLIFIYHCVQACLINFEQIISNHCRMNFIIAHNSFRQISIRLMICFTVNSTKQKWDINFLCELYSQQFVFTS